MELIMKTSSEIDISPGLAMNFVILNRLAVFLENLIVEHSKQYAVEFLWDKANSWELRLLHFRSKLTRNLAAQKWSLNRNNTKAQR